MYVDFILCIKYNIKWIEFTINLIIFLGDNMNKLFKSIASGILIGVGGIVYLSCDIKYIGAFLFSLGLFTICEFGLKLYTGEVGYIFINKGTFYLEVLKTLFGNIIGTFVAGIMTTFSKPGISEKALMLCNSKLEQKPVQTLILAFFCGALMFIAVNTYRRGSGIGRYIGIFTAVPVFILSGFEHCMADMYYFFSAGIVSFKMSVFIVLCIIGNALGAFAMAYFNDK